MSDVNYELFKKIFFDKLERKTGWGKNEIKIIFAESMADAFIENAKRKAVERGIE